MRQNQGQWLGQVIAGEAAVHHQAGLPGNPADYADVQFTDDQVEFLEVGDGKVDNRLPNIGAKAHRNFVVELKRA